VKTSFHDEEKQSYYDKYSFNKITTISKPHWLQARRVYTSQSGKCKQSCYTTPYGSIHQCRKSVALGMWFFSNSLCQSV